MILRQLTVDRFRNLARVELEPAPGVTLFWGRNAQGKTNLLEAVHYAATGRSFRTRLDRECLAWDADSPAVARIEARVERGAPPGFRPVRRMGCESCESCDAAEPAGVAHQLAVSITDRAKFAWVDGKALVRLGDLLGKLMVVLFTPDDLGIAAGSPALRRRYLDLALSQTSAAYLHHLQNYVEALRQRNAALRLGDGSLGPRGCAGEGGLDPWAGPLVEHGVEVALARRKAAGELAVLARELYARIAPGDPPLQADYRSGAAVGREDDREPAREHFRRRLAEAAETERARRQTLVGPHRDNLILTVGGREVRDYGSQGQQRSAVLALRLAEVRWMAQQTGETPLLLVDDLGTELDQDRRTRLLPLFGHDVQTLATTAGDPALLGPLIGADRAIEVQQGQLVGT